MKTLKQQNNDMISLICNAYTYLEFNKSFYKYYDCMQQGEFESELLAREHWDNNIVKDYLLVSEYMKPAAIKQAQKFIMGEF